MNEPEYVLSGRAVAIMRAVLGDMPPQSPAETSKTGKVDWGDDSNKARARYAAALIGKEFKADCPNCDSDLFQLITSTVRAADAARADMRNQSIH